MDAELLSACLGTNLPIRRAGLSVAGDGGGLRQFIPDHH
jgi:hypothetical protein